MSIGGAPAEEGGAAGEGECRSSTVGTTTGGSSGVWAPLFPCRSVCVWVSAGTSTVGGVAPDSKRNAVTDDRLIARSEEHTSELQSLMRISYAVFCLKKKIYTAPE